MTSPDYFCHPQHQGSLFFDGAALRDPLTGDSFPVINGIPRFCNADNYSESFGYQWSKFSRTQLDSHSGSDQSESRFYAVTGWTPEDLSRGRILEVGSGAGRFSEVFLSSTRGILFSVDYSNSVEVNFLNNSKYGDRFKLAQASIYELPFRDNSFDKVFCLGVLQHTPSFPDSVAALVKKTRIGGEIVVDFYPLKAWYTKVHAKYLFRPILRMVPNRLLLRVIQINISWMIIFFDLLCALRLGVLTRFLPIADLRLFPEKLTRLQRKEWAIMDTFDCLSPRYDNPQRVEAVVQMFSSSGCEVLHAGSLTYKSGTAMVVRARRVK